MAETRAERAARRAEREARNLTRSQVRAGRGELEGLDTVLANLNREIGRIAVRSRGGVRKALLIVRRASVLLTPVDTGNLRNSVFTEVEERITTGVTGTIGYTAAYAPFVHEIDADYTVGQWKFLETALAENHEKILKAIADGVRLR